MNGWQIEILLILIAILLLLLLFSLGDLREEVEGIRQAIETAQEVDRP